MPRGRKTTPKSLAKLRGNPRKGRVSSAVEPVFETAIPPAPDYLQGQALIEWDRITTELAAKQIITHVDMAIVAIYAQTWADLIHHTEALANEDEIITSTRGIPQINPRIKLVNQIKDQVAKYSSELGITPTARNKVRMVGGGTKKPTKEQALAESLFRGAKVKT